MGSWSESPRLMRGEESDACHDARVECVGVATGVATGVAVDVAYHDARAIISEPYGSHGAGIKTGGRGGRGGGGGAERFPSSAAAIDDRQRTPRSAALDCQQGGPSGLMGGGRADDGQRGEGLIMSKLTDRLTKTLRSISPTRRSVSPTRRSGAPVRIREEGGGGGRGGGRGRADGLSIPEHVQSRLNYLQGRMNVCDR